MDPPEEWPHDDPDRIDAVLGQLAGLREEIHYVYWREWDRANGLMLDSDWPSRDTPAQ